MTEPLLSDAEFVRRLGAHPDLRNRMESLLLAVEDETGDLKTADAAEMRVIREMRHTGQIALQPRLGGEESAWAQCVIVDASAALQPRPPLRGKIGPPYDH